MISSTAVIHENVRLGENVIIHDFVVIYPHTEIKDNVEIYDHCVIGKPPSIPGREQIKKYDTLVIGENSILCPGVVLYTGAKVGKGTLLGDYCSIREGSVVGDHCVIGRRVGINHSTTIGNNVHIMDGSSLTEMIVEDNVFISAHVACASDNSFGADYDPQKAKGPHIKSGAKIGLGAILLPQVVIGENALVGAGAVVTKDVPPRDIVLGIPAKSKKQDNGTLKIT